MGKYIDSTAILQVIGTVYANQQILEMEDKYSFTSEDFPETFHKIIFGSIANLYNMGARNIDTIAIENYLEQRPEKLAIYKAQKGAEYLAKISTDVTIAAFDYYYSRMKKMTLMRAYSNAGLDLSYLYDTDNIMDIKKKQVQEDWFDNTPIDQIADLIDKKISDIRLSYINDSDSEAVNAGGGALDLLERLKLNPEVGYPMWGEIWNSITRGARMGKFYIRSAATGVGKSRSMIADACYIGCDEIYDLNQNKWVSTGPQQPTMYITTEQEIEEVQTMMIAFLSGVDEERILNNEYFSGEWERVVYATQILSKAKLFVKQLPDFSMEDIENTIKRGIRDIEVQYIFFDYIHTSMKILSEVSSKAGVKGLREDNVLFMISIKLKDICVKYNVFILTSTQLNAEYKSAKEYDQNLLRGAKSIADKCDLGAIMLETDAEDLVSLESVMQEGGFPVPQIKISIYKNRRGRHKGILLWCAANRGICRITPVFATNYQYELIPIEPLKINVKQEGK